MGVTEIDLWRLAAARAIRAENWAAMTLLTTDGAPADVPGGLNALEWEARVLAAECSDEQLAEMQAAFVDSLRFEDPPPSRSW